MARCFNRRTATVIISVILGIAVVQGGLFVSVSQAQEYYIGFKTEEITVTTPAAGKTVYKDSFALSGTTVLEQIWALVKGPGGEINVYPIEAKDGSFSKNIGLRHGPGVYTIWVDNNPRKYSGKIRFTVTGTVKENKAYLTPSGYVNSNNPEIIELAGSLCAGLKTDWEKAMAIHDWMTQNVSYDYALYLAGNYTTLNTSESVLKTRTGLCRDYAFLTAAIGRAAGIETRVVYGKARSNGEWIGHAWNEMYVDGRWAAMDTSWDAGYIQDNKFVKSPGRKFFNFAMGPGTTHIAEKYSLD